MGKETIFVVLSVILVLLSGCNTDTETVNNTPETPITQTNENRYEIEISGNITAINDYYINGYRFTAITLDGNTYAIDQNPINLELGRQIMFVVTYENWRGLYHVLAGEFLDDKGDPTIILWQGKISGGTE